jgi:hypothetical protein
VTEFPIKNYYRYVASPAVLSGLDGTGTGGAGGGGGGQPLASFRQLPRGNIFTVRMDVPEAWNVQARLSPQDIDNLVCDGRSCGDKPGSDNSFVSYSLKNLLVAGQCYDFSTDEVSPPNGLQLTLDAVRRDNPYLFPDTASKTSSSSSSTSSSTSSSSSTTTSSSRQIHSDTLVMQNLGYYQLQADAGLYLLRLAQGKARALFSMESEGALHGYGDMPIATASADATATTADATDVDADVDADATVTAGAGAGAGAIVGILVPVKAFTEAAGPPSAPGPSAGAGMLRVTKRAGMEHVPLLEDPDSKPKKASRSIRRKKGDRDKGDKDNSAEEEGSGSGVVDSVWKSVSGMFGKTEASAPAVTSAASNETIHVFSLATGHAYERLLRIMMLSVSKRTKSPLKFWLFENYLSPTFKQLASAMAVQYGFEVAYVTYKWPKWLTEQTDKQRIIWGYKILFLDVLFPLDVKKVIYVDADQTVRADLKVSTTAATIATIATAIATTTTTVMY